MRRAALSPERRGPAEIMAITHTCPICGSRMFHDKGNHITFCAECDHVGWPHDALAPGGQPKDAAVSGAPRPVELDIKKQREEE